MESTRIGPIYNFVEDLTELWLNQHGRKADCAAIQINLDVLVGIVEGKTFRCWTCYEK